MFKLMFTAAVALAAASAAAQSGGTSAPPAPAQPAPAPSGQAAPAADNPIQQAAMAFGQCVSSGIEGVAPSIAPEAGATQVLGGCATQRRQLEQAVETVIATLPEERKTAARTQLQTQLAQAEPQVVAAIRQQRVAAAPPQPAAATPTE